MAERAESPSGIPWLPPVLSLAGVVLILVAYMFAEPELRRLEFDAPAAQPWLLLLFTAPLVHACSGWGMARRARALRAFGYDPARSASWLVSLRKRRWRRTAVLAAALCSLAAAAVQPRCNPEKTKFKTTARDIALVLDVSKSMLAQDIQPSRLDRAKLEIADLADEIKRKGSGDRLGLIAFAGDAVIKCPLTSNYSYFKDVLRNVDHRSASQGGSRIGDAVRKALSDLLGVATELSPEERGAQAGETVMAGEMKGKKEAFADIILITDGEDMDSFPVHAARAAAAADVGIYAVGLGSEQGTPIPIRGEGGRVEYLRSRDGEVVRSKLDSKTLQDMVNTSPRGRYLPVGTYDFDLADFFRKTIALETGREVEEEQIFWTEIFQPFLLAGLALYLVYIVFSERPRQGQLATLETAP